MARRIIAKAALSILRDDIQKVAGPYQLCAGQVAGVEAAVHRVRSAFLQEDTDAILLANASNALNCAVALHSIQQICPSFAPILINTYRSAAGLFIAGDTLYLKKAPPREILWPCRCNSTTDQAYFRWGNSGMVC